MGSFETLAWDAGRAHCGRFSPSRFGCKCTAAWAPGHYGHPQSTYLTVTGELWPRLIRSPRRLGLGGEDRPRIYLKMSSQLVCPSGSLGNAVLSAAGGALGRALSGCRLVKAGMAL